MWSAQLARIVSHKVVFSPEARDDLRQLYIYIAERAGDGRAMAYIERIETYCRGFSTFPERGTKRDDIRANLRIKSYARRVVIAFSIDALNASVAIHGVFYGGQNVERLLPEDES